MATCCKTDPRLPYLRGPMNGGIDRIEPLGIPPGGTCPLPPQLPGGMHYHQAVIASMLTGFHQQRRLDHSHLR